MKGSRRGFSKLPFALAKRLGKKAISSFPLGRKIAHAGRHAAHAIGSVAGTVGRAAHAIGDGAQVVANVAEKMS